MQKKFSFEKKDNIIYIIFLRYVWFIITSDTIQLTELQ